MQGTRVLLFRGIGTRSSPRTVSAGPLKAARIHAAARKKLDPSYPFIPWREGSEKPSTNNWALRLQAGSSSAMKFPPLPQWALARQSAERRSHKGSGPSWNRRPERDAANRHSRARDRIWTGHFAPANRRYPQ